MYHGSPEERAELRSTQMVLPKEDLDKYWIGHSSTPRAKSNAARKRFQSPKKKKASSHDDEYVKTPRAKGFFGGNGKGQGERELPPYQKTTFPVVITTYEMLMKDRVHLVNYRWGFIVVDEGHRLKNMDCKLMQEIKQIRADGRMVLTGTPLQVGIIPSFIWIY